MKKTTMMFVASAVLMIMMTACGYGPPSASTSSSNSSSNNTIVVGSKSFTESILVGNMMYDLLKANLKGVTIENKSNLGGTMVPWNAIQSGQLDLYCEYTGTGLVDILKQPVSHDPNATYQTVKTQYPQKFNIDWLNPIGFNDTYAIAVPQSVANQYHLKTISDLKAVASKLTFGAEPEYFSRPDGYAGLIGAYGLQFGSKKELNVGLKYEAVASNQVQVIDVFSTDGQLTKYNMTVLNDDKNFFPPYYAAPIVRESTLKAHPEVATILNKLTGKLDNSSMQQLNYQVDVQHKSADTVAKQFLISAGLLSA
ncbi:glycine/betaine ABC transporter substrate-binding protein [Ktedonobacteria bacterium brp13]|nr:glycine/betaine ABC transporter substrate-binding protein [Ktedonobacteria bacterium brp13]